MRVPVIIHAGEDLVRAMDDKVYEQATNVAGLPGGVGAVMVMPDAHWGYGFPIGAVAAFDPQAGGVVSAGGVGFDISCGVRCLRTNLSLADLRSNQSLLADALEYRIPAGLGSTSGIRLKDAAMQEMLAGGAVWAVDQGYGQAADLQWIEEGGCAEGALPDCVSDHAKQRQRDELGTLGSGNHYLEVQRVAEVFERVAAERLGLALDAVVVSIHCGSRGLGHQVGTDYLKAMVTQAPRHGIRLVDRELACAPIESKLGGRYLGAMRAAINCALANRQVITHFARAAFEDVVPGTRLDLIYDVSHNTCKLEDHDVEGVQQRLYVHRKGATRAFGPGNAALPPAIRDLGQPVFIGGSMGTASYILLGQGGELNRAFASACHGAGRAMSRHQALRTWEGRQVVDALAARGILVRSRSMRGVAEEAPGAYKDVSAVVDAAEAAGLARKLVRLEPLVCIKG